MILIVLRFGHGKTSSNRSGVGGAGPKSRGRGHRSPTTASRPGRPPARALPGQPGTNRRSLGCRAGERPSASSSVSRPSDGRTPPAFAVGRTAARVAVGGPGRRFSLPLAGPGPGWRTGGALGHAGGLGETIRAQSGPRSILPISPAPSLAQGRAGHPSSQERSCRPGRMEKKHSRRSWRPF